MADAIHSDHAQRVVVVRLSHPDECGNADEHDHPQDDQRKDDESFAELRRLRDKCQGNDGC